MQARRGKCGGSPTCPAGVSGARVRISVRSDKRTIDSYLLTSDRDHREAPAVGVGCAILLDIRSETGNERETAASVAISPSNRERRLVGARSVGALRRYATCTVWADNSPATHRCAPRGCQGPDSATPRGRSSGFTAKLTGFRWLAIESAVTPRPSHPDYLNFAA